MESVKHAHLAVRFALMELKMAVLNVQMNIGFKVVHASPLLVMWSIVQVLDKSFCLGKTASDVVVIVLLISVVEVLQPIGLDIFNLQRPMEVMHVFHIMGYSFISQAVILEDLQMKIGIVMMEFSIGVMMEQELAVVRVLMLHGLVSKVCASLITPCIQITLLLFFAQLLLNVNLFVLHVLMDNVAHVYLATE